MWPLARSAHRAGARVRPEVAAGARSRPPVEGDARPGLLGQQQVGIALVVAQLHVVARLELLDQVGFEQKGLRDRVGLGHLDVDHPVDDAADAVDLAARRLLLPVAPDAAAETLRLADIDDVAARVLHEIDAGLVGQLGQR